MSYRKNPIIAGQIYHIYNRGVNHQPIFFNFKNWDFFLRKLKIHFVPKRVSVLAYCLMPNHFHMIVKVLTDNFGQEIMHPFSVSYTKAVNKQLNRVGPIFQGPYKAKFVETDESLLELSKYIHQNPVKSNLVNHPEEWRYSSYKEYIDPGKNELVYPEYILEIIGSSNLYRSFVEMDV